MKLASLPALFFTLTVGFCNFNANAADIPQSTEVITYQPKIANVPEKEGSCWTDSLAVSRPGAWRCMVGNEIFDPCFSTANPHYVVCNVSPIRQNKHQFNLKLTQSLPKPSKTETSANPWLLELADKSICTLQTGTLAFVDKKPLEYSCSHPQRKQSKELSGITIIDKQQPVWLAQKVTYVLAKQGIRVTKTENISVNKAWY